jgi:hypothetical protein
MAGASHLAGVFGFPVPDHLSLRNQHQPNEKLHTNSIALEKTFHTNHTRCTTTTGGGAIADASKLTNTPIRSISTQKKSTGRKRRR